MKTTKTEEININGINLSATEDGHILRHRKTGSMRNLLTSGQVGASGYYNITIGGKSFSVHRIIAAAFIPEFSSDLEVDHINGNRLDNRIENLRMATRSDNLTAYRSPIKGGTSKYRGVSWCKTKNHWRATISKSGKYFNLGFHKSETDAARAYDKKATELGFKKEALNWSCPEFIQYTEDK